MKRLDRATLASLPPTVARPGYDLGAVRVGVVHLGVGAFHRAHQAVYFDDRLAAGERDWAICGASLRAADTAEALDPQDGLYTLAVRSGDDERLRVIGSLRRLLVAPRDPQALLAAMSDPAVRVVSLTVTEKGYCHDPATGALNEDHPDIRADLATPETPRSAPGFLVEAARRRRAAGVAPFTVLTCDNLPHNGAVVAGVLTRLATLRDPELGRYVAEAVRCPATMVDRIVPATTDADRARIAEHLGAEDRWPVVTEPFCQWVIEDAFGPGGRPRLEDAGAQMVADVAPFELMKLRLLNGSHSLLAYLGYLAGYETIADTMADPAFAALARRLMDHEVTPTLPRLPGADLPAYKAQLIERFRNPALHHRTWQIAMDGSQKLPQRFLGTVRDRLRAGASIDVLALGIAAWIRYAAGRDEAGQPIDVRDPLAARFAALAANHAQPDDLARAFFGMADVFGPDLPGDPRFTAPVVAALRSLVATGAKRTVAALASS